MCAHKRFLFFLINVVLVAVVKVIQSLTLSIVFFRLLL